MVEELNRRSRLATALIAGPAVTVGLLGVGAAPVFADDHDDDPQDGIVDDENPGEDEDDGGAGEGAGGSEDEGSNGEGSEDSEEGNEDELDGSEGEDDEEANEDEADESLDPGDEGLNAAVTVESDEVEPGGQITVVGQDFPAGEEVEFRSSGVTIGTATADDNGDLYAEITIPEDAEPGSTDLSAVFGDGSVASSSYTVVDADNGDDGDEDESADEAQEVTPEAPERYDNTVVIPDVEGVTYEISGEPQEPGSSITLTEDEPSLVVMAFADEGYVFDEDAETSWSFQWDPGFEDIWPVDPPEDWEADEDRWYSNVPQTHLPDGYADWIIDFANSANRNADGWQEFEADTQVYAEPDMDAETLGDAFPTDGAVWWGYLEDEDFWIIVHQYTGAAGFLPGESHLGEEPPVDEEASISLDSSEVEPGDDITVSGEGFEPGEEVELTLSGVVLGTVTADDDGDVEAELTIPEDTEFGDYTVTAVGAQSGNGGSASLTVIDPDDSDPAEPSLSLDVDEVEAGGEVTAVGEGFEPGEDVEFSLNPELGTAPADDDGEVTAVLTIPEDTDPGEYALTATGAESEREASATITVVDAEEEEDPEVDPGLTVDPEEIALEDFVGEAEEGAGVEHLVVGLEPGTAVESVTVGPEHVTDYAAVHTADDNGEITFRIVGFDTAPDPSVYLGDYTTVVTFEDEDGDVTELEASFTVVADDDDPTPPEDDGDDDAASDDQEPAGGVSDHKGGDELAQTGVSGTGLGLIAGLLLLIGGALAVFGYRGRWARGKA